MIHFISKQLSLDDPTITHHTDISALEWWMVEALSDKRLLSVDTETTGLNFLDDKLLLAQIGDETDQWVIDCTTIDAHCLKDILESKNVLKLFHNVKFDYKFFRSKLDITCENCYDVMLAEQVIHGGKASLRHNLAAITERRLGYKLSKGERMEFVKHRGLFTASQVTYAAKDLIPLFGIYAQQIKDADTIKPSQSLTIRLENHAALAFADIEYNGMGVDTERWLANAAVVKPKLDEAKKDMYRMLDSDAVFAPILPKRTQLDLFANEDESRIMQLEKSFSFSSPKQMLTLVNLFDKSITSTAVGIINDNQHLHPILRRYMEYKKLEKQYSTYGPAFLEALWSDGKVHTTFKQILNTGRVSSKNPPMQTLPADNTYRNCFTADEGWVFVSSDFAGQELCIIAEMSQDPVWLEALREGRDLHSLCSALVFGAKWEAATEDNCAYYTQNQQKCECKQHKKLRTQIKSINFG